MSRPLLFCVPYAGGSASIYLRWSRLLGDMVEVVPVELAGRGSRIREQARTSARAHAEDVATAISSRLADEGERDVLLWGHSMGALIAYEAYYALRRRCYEPGRSAAVLPAHMVLSGRTPPHLGTRTDYHRLGDDDFLDAVDLYGGGTAKTLRSSEELRELFLPLLRADFTVSETYEWTDRGVLVESPVTLLNGEDDATISHDLLGGWQDLIGPAVVDRRVPGGHFFIFEQGDLVRETVRAMTEVLSECTQSLTRKAFL